jgi:hypothetical protein
MAHMRPYRRSPSPGNPATKGALLCLLASALASSSFAAQEKSATTPGAPAAAPPGNPQLLSFDELVTLAATAKPEGALGARLDSLLNTPIVQTEAINGDSKPHRPDVNGLGAVLRVGLWNIERGLNFELVRAALADRIEFLRLAGTQPGRGLRQKQMVESQLAALHDVDVLILNEAD